MFDKPPLHPDSLRGPGFNGCSVVSRKDLYIYDVRGDVIQDGLHGLDPGARECKVGAKSTFIGTIDLLMPRMSSSMRNVHTAARFHMDPYAW